MIGNKTPETGTRYLGAIEASTALGTEYRDLGRKLISLNSHEKQEALEIAEKMKTILLEVASGQSKSQHFAQIARKLAEILFNKFRISDFDDLSEEVIAAGKKIITFDTPPEIE